jgi:type IV pilus assembly protein PilW
MQRLTAPTSVRQTAAAAALRGFSLVELMVAMTLSLILLGGVIAIFSSSRSTYETTDRLSRIQESGRFALDSMVRDLRATGFIGCSQLAQFTNTLKTPTNVFWNFANSVQGYDGQGSAWVPAIDATIFTAPTPITNTDILVARVPRPGARQVRVMTTLAATTDPVVVDPDLQANFKANDILMISDCNARAVFEVTAVNANSLAHAESNATRITGSPTSDPATPGNISNDLLNAYVGSNALGGAEVVPMQTVIYYLARRNGATGDVPPSLFRRVAGLPAEELVEGVENMQLAFGETTGANAVTYRKASAVTNWNNVVSVNIALLVRSLSAYGTDRDQSTYDLIDATLGTRVPAPNDRHMRQVFATTVSLRNTTL